MATFILRTGMTTFEDVIKGVFSAAKKSNFSEYNPHNCRVIYIRFFHKEKMLILNIAHDFLLL